MLEFDADLLQFAAVWRRMNRAYLSPNRRRLGLYVQAHDLQRDSGSDDIVVAGRIAAAVQIYAGGNGSLDKRLGPATFPEEDQRDAAVEVLATAGLFLIMVLSSSRESVLFLIDYSY